MKLPRILTGLAAALAAAMFIGLAAPAAIAQDNPATAPAAPAAAPAAPAAAAPAAPAAAASRPLPPPRLRRRGRRVPETDKFAAVPAVQPSYKLHGQLGGDTAWVLTSVALVLMMTIPGLGLFYGGMVQQEERRRHGDDELRHHGAGDGDLLRRHLFSLAFTGGSAVHRRVLAACFLQGIH